MVGTDLYFLPLTGHRCFFIVDVLSSFSALLVCIAFTVLVH